VEDEESLEACTVISELSDSIKAKITGFFSDGIVSSRKDIGSILLP
jgi:hypothetical protein